MKHSHLLALIGLSALLFTACDPNKPGEPTGSYPKKHLIEEFTGQACGYCPYGMDCIHQFVGNDTNWIVVLHHYGYAADHFSVKESKTVTTALGVNGAPSMAIDRAKTNYGADKGIVFHPGYLEEMNMSQFETTTYASIQIANTYDPETRELHIHLSGVIDKADAPDLQLTVLIKESGMIDTQADYYDTFEGWQEFRHTNAVREFLTDAKGDPIYPNNEHRYYADYYTTLSDKWVAENCMVVAFLSETFKPVVQAEQRPVVAGTQGGADIQHGGVTPVPVPDYYPEPNATDGPYAFSAHAAEEMTNAYLYYQKAQNVTYWFMQAYDLTATSTIENSTCIPFTQIYFVTSSSADVNAIPYGVYYFSDSEDAGTAVAGYRVDSPTQQIGGSQFYYADLSYFNEGYLVPAAQWLIADGLLTISEEGWHLTGTARNGSDIHLTGGTIKLKGAMNAPKKVASPHSKRQIIAE